MSLALAIPFPLAFVLTDILIVVRSVGQPQPFPWFALVYTIVDYIGVPLALVAILLGHTALALSGQEPGGARVAKVALTIGYLSLAVPLALALLLFALQGVLTR